MRSSGICGRCIMRCPRRIGGDMPRWKPRHLGMEVYNMLPSCFLATRTRFTAARRTSSSCRGTRPGVASPKKGGRKLAEIAQPGLVETVEAVVEQDTAGSPVDENVMWTNRSPADIANDVRKEGFEVSADTIKRILTGELNLSRRAALRSATSSFTTSRRRVANTKNTIGRS